MEHHDGFLKLYHHPDDLFDSPYTEVELNTAPYKTLGGDVRLLDRDCRGVTLSLGDGGAIRLEAYQNNIIRLRAIPEGSVFEESITVAYGLVQLNIKEEHYTFEQDSAGCLFTSGKCSLRIDSQTQNISMHGPQGETLLQTIKGGLRFSEEAPDYGGKRMLCHFKLEEERFFGFGGRIMHPDRTGTSVDIFDVKVGVLSGDYGGFPVPFFMSTKGYGVFFNNPWPHVYFDMGRSNPEEWFLHAPGGDCDLFLMYGPEFPQIVDSYTNITGKVPFPEKWWFGFWCSSLLFKSSEEVIAIAERLRAEKYPCDVIVLDGAWRGGANFIEQYLSNSEYPSNDMNWHEDFGNGPEMMKTLKRMGFKTSLHVNSRNFSPETIEAGVAKGYLRNHGKETVVRVTKPEAEKFYEGMVEPRILEGVDLWWTDHADRVSGEIDTGIPSRNLFGALWNRLLTSFMIKNGKSTSICLTRGSGIGGQKYGLPWPGDTRNGIEYYEEDIWFALNAGLAGFSFTSADLGGFTLKYPPNDEIKYPCDQVKYDEVFDIDNITRRCLQSIFFVPMPRIHNNWCTMPKLPWNCPQETRELYREFLNERYKLTPYIFSAAIHSALSGEPILRPLVYAFRNDKKVYGIGDEFLMGDSLLIAPVTEEKATSRQIYLPEGKWVNLWNDQEFAGPCTIDVEAPHDSLEGLPVYVKKDSILTRQPVRQYLDASFPEELTLDVYMDHKAELVLHESCDVSNRFLFTFDGVRLSLKLENHTPLIRKYTLRFHGIHAVSAVLLSEINILSGPVYIAKENITQFEIEIYPDM